MKIHVTVEFEFDPIEYDCSDEPGDVHGLIKEILDGIADWPPGEVVVAYTNGRVQSKVRHTDDGGVYVL